MRKGLYGRGVSPAIISIYVFLVIWLVVSIFPFYWLIVSSTLRTNEIFSFPPRLTFGDYLVQNLHSLFTAIPFFGSMFNTAFVSVSNVILTLFFCSLAGFAFAKFNFPGKSLLFVLLLVTMFVPGQVSMIPSFVIIKTLGWVNSFKALIIPGAASAFGIFWIRQFVESALPDDLLNAGRIDGCGNFRLYYHVALPVMRPALAGLGLFSFIGNWNDYMWPLIVLSDPHKYTLQIMLSSLYGLYGTNFGMVLAGTLMATVPLGILFAVFSRRLMGAVTVGAIKS